MEGLWRTLEEEEEEGEKGKEASLGSTVWMGIKILGGFGVGLRPKKQKNKRRKKKKKAMLYISGACRGGRGGGGGGGATTQEQNGRSVGWFARFGEPCLCG